MCRNIAPSSTPRNADQNISFVLTPENDDHLSKTLIRKSEKSVSNANHDMYSVASQACFIPDRYGLLMQSLKALKTFCEEQFQALYLTSLGS